MAKKQVVGVKMDYDGAKKLTSAIVTVSYPAIGKSVSIDYLGLSPEMKLQAGLHGLKQKLGDAESGGSASEKHAMAARIIGGLREGQWELTATPVDQTPIVCEALSRLKKVPYAKMMDAAKKAGEEKVKEWGGNAQVRAMILKIRAEKAEKLAEEMEEEDLEIPGL